MSESDEKQKEKKMITSLGDRRERDQKVRRKQYLTAEQRIAELEADVLRLVDISIMQEETIRKLEDRLWKLLRLFSAEDKQPKKKTKPGK